MACRQGCALYELKDITNAHVVTTAAGAQFNFKLNQVTMFANQRLSTPAGDNVWHVEMPHCGQ
jgi:hypothetical protein